MLATQKYQFFTKRSFSFQTLRWFYRVSLTISMLIIPLTLPNILYAQHNNQAAFRYAIQGNIPKDALKNVNRRLDIAKKLLGDKPSAHQIEQFYQQVPNNIKKALQPYGYFHSTVSSERIDDRNFIFHISPGQAIKIVEINVRVIGPGGDHEEFTTYLNALPIKKGDILITPRYTQVKSDLLTIANDLGYIKVKFTTQDVLVDLNTNKATITLILQTGQRFYFGEVTFSKSNIDESLLKRYIPFQQGEPFSSKKLLLFQDHLTRSNYFSLVKVKARMHAVTDQLVPIHVQLAPGKKYNYSIGVGYGTDTSVRASLLLEDNWVNRYGHKFQVLLQGNAKEKNIEGRYIIPGKNPLTDQYIISGSAFKLATPSGLSYGQQLTGSYVMTRGESQYTLSLTGLRERNTRQFVTEDDTSTLVYPSFNWRLLHADDPINVSNGYRISLSLLGAAKKALSDVSFAQGRLDGKYITSFNEKNRVILRGAIGYTHVDDVYDLPISLRFQAGGSQSIRGYQYKGIGPGKALIELSAEYQHLIFGKWYGAAFFDAGNVTDTFTTKLRKGVGLGIARRTPIGTIEIGIARPLNRTNPMNGVKDDPYRFVFSIGPDL